MQRASSAVNLTVWKKVSISSNTNIALMWIFGILEMSLTFLNQFQHQWYWSLITDQWNWSEVVGRWSDVCSDGSRQVRLRGRREEEEKRAGAKITLHSSHHRQHSQPARGAWSMGVGGQRSGWRETTEGVKRKAEENPHLFFWSMFHCDLTK